MTPECTQGFFEAGISGKKNHLAVRSRCIKEFEIAYGYMPLVGSTYQAVRPWCKPYHYFYNLIALVYNLL